MFAKYILPLLLFVVLLLALSSSFKLYLGLIENRKNSPENKGLALGMFLVQCIVCGFMLIFGYLCDPENKLSSMGVGAEVISWLMMGSAILMGILTMIEFLLIIFHPSDEQKTIEQNEEQTLEDLEVQEEISAS